MDTDQKSTIRPNFPGLRPICFDTQHSSFRRRQPLQGRGVRKELFFTGKINHEGFDLEGYYAMKRAHYDANPDKRVSERITTAVRFLERMGFGVVPPDPDAGAARFAEEVQRTKERAEERRGCCRGDFL